MVIQDEAKVPLAGNVVSVILQMATFGILSFCLARRMQNVTKWKKIPIATLLILIIYADSILFVFVTAIISRGVGINESHVVCDSAIVLCLACYMTTKILIYYFLVEKAYIVRGSRLPRIKTKLWMFNCFGMLLPYCIIVALNFVYRIAYINDQGICIIGMKKMVMLPLISFDVVVNVYLTLLFIIPLRRLYSYQNNKNTSLRVVTFRSFIGSCATLISSVVNLTVLMVLRGEPAWICLMCCNADVLFSAVVLHWVTQVDRNQMGSSSNSQPTAPAGTDAPKDDTTIRSQRNSLNIWTGGGALSEPKKTLAGTITTEIKASPHLRRNDSEEEIVELRGIRVHTERTTEVEVDARSEESSTERSYGQYTAERSVSAQKMV